MITETPDSRYTAENLAEISATTVADLNEAAERMAYWPREDKALTTAWMAAYEATQTELLARVRARRAR